MVFELGITGSNFFLFNLCHANAGQCFSLRHEYVLMFQGKQTFGFSVDGISENNNHACDPAGSSADEIL